MKLTSALLQRIVQEEVAKFGDEKATEDAAKDTEEVDADELGTALSKKIDYAKALKIEEARLVRRLRHIHETRTRVIAKIKKSLV